MSQASTQQTVLHAEIHEWLVPQDTLFLHGNLGSTRWWHPSLAVFKERAAGKRHRGSLIFMDWRGSGRSPAPTSADDMRMERLARDCVENLARLGRGPVNIVGHSTGGLIALLAMRLAPRSFHRAVLLDPVGPKGLVIGGGMRMAFQRMTCDRAFTAGMIASVIHGPASHLPFVSLELGDDAFRAAKTIGPWVLDALDGVDYEREIRQVPNRTLVLHGEHDALVPQRDSRLLAKLLRNGSFAMLEGRGHCCNIEDPERFVDAVARFFFC